ncbi:MAG: Uma2 family endonuclease [Planctomycetes bacterium]|nr:Uma2 family endonuclease [Planctomycetota bacterium]MBI3845587.1 Uma2 family endonuclease [Planctomycetota bacterium]
MPRPRRAQRRLRLRGDFLSPSSRVRDAGKKRRLYADYGVREYWSVDPVKRTVVVHVREGGVLVKKATVTRGKVE